jgi:hypothetical protein
LGSRTGKLLLSRIEKEAAIMKSIVHALCCLLLVSSGIARADAILTGTVSVTYPNGGGTLTDSGSGSSILLHVGSGQPFSTISGNVGPTSGTVTASMGADFIPPAFFTTASADYTLSVTGKYMLTGGTGIGLADWTVYGFTLGSGPAQWTSCSITFGGITEICSPGFGSPSIGSFLVPFNTPLDLSFNATYHGFVGMTDSHVSTLTYNFDVSPVPEPATALLVSTGLAWLAALRRRAARI